MMKRYPLILAFMALATPALAQTTTSQAEESARVSSTLKAASSQETLPGMGEHEAAPDASVAEESDAPADTSAADGAEEATAGEAASASEDESSPSGAESTRNSPPSPEEAPERDAAVAASEPDDSGGATTGQASAESMPPSCTQLKVDIGRKIRANGVPNFTLEVLPSAKAQQRVAATGDGQQGGEIVGSCGSGSYKVVYRKT